MNNIVSTQNNSFENIKTIKNNSEYWSARDLMKTLNYLRWENFDEVIKKAKIACKNSNQEIKEHFRDITKTLTTGNKAKIKVVDMELDRYAYYLIAQNGDSRKPQIALAQTYFAIQTRRQESKKGNYSTVLVQLN